MANISSITAYMNTMNNVKGMTLIELMVTMGVIVILLAIGVPSMQGTSQNNRLDSAISSLSSDFAFARSEAVTRNVSVRIRSFNGNTDWSGGWIVETMPTAGASVRLRNSPALAANILLAAKTGAATSLTYNSDGSQTAGLLTFRACKKGDTSSHGREVRVNATGRIKHLTKQGCP